MKLPDHFHEFLANTVNLSKGKLELLDSRVNSVYKVLSEDAVLGPFVRDKIPQGSWAHETIINPQGNTEFDADFLLLLEANPKWAANPSAYIEETYAALWRSRYRAQDPSRKCRCVRVTYANDCHIDIVPFLYLPDGKVIVNRDENKWEVTNPDGFTAWMRDKDDITGGNLRKVIRILKFLRDYKGTFRGTRSVILTTLVGERVSMAAAAANPGCYADVPTTLVTVVNNLNRWLQDRPTRPSIEDPSGTGLTLDHRWNDEAYENLRTRIASYSAQMTEAYEDTDEASSVAKWQDLFGPGFKPPAGRSTSGPFGPVPVVPVRPGRGG